jgi:hypothetical protein
MSSPLTCHQVAAMVEGAVAGVGAGGAVVGGAAGAVGWHAPVGTTAPDLP